ncbi:MAG TPA: hypothetical protein VGL72_07980 [Bryobacteraceae bacterium]
MFDDSQVWLMIGVMVGAMAVLVFIGIMVNAYITSRRLANVLNDVEEILHSDFKALEDKIEAAINKVRTAELRSNRD